MTRISLFFILLLISMISLHAQQVRKNVLLIMVDDMNDWIEPFGGHPQAKTPNIKAFAEKAVVFQAASCASPVCNPSRTALLTGRRGHETKITNNTFEGSKQNFRESSQAWIKNLVTLPQYFSQQGYETVNQGKIFHTHNFDPISWKVVGPGGQGCNAGSSKSSVAGTDLEWSEWTGQLNTTGDFKSANYCANYLSTTHSKPFFLACGIFRPHLPFYAPKQYFDLFPLSTIQLPEGYKANDLADIGKDLSHGELAQVQASGKWKEVVRAYLANLAFADACVGHLLDKLAASPYANNTIVVIAGDHGWHLGEKDHFHKYTLWERAVKTPLIIYDPSLGTSGNCMKAVSLQDIYPTLLDLCELPTPQYPVRGRSLKPLLTNPTNQAWKGAALCSYGDGHHSLRSDRYRYIRMSNGDEELYDMSLDKWEFNNLAKISAHASVLTQMRKALNDMLVHNENPFGSNQPEDPLPLVSLSVTPSQLTLPATITLSALPTDNGSITKIEFIINGSWVATDLTAPYTLNWSVPAAGTYTFMARATDNAGGVGSSETTSIQIQSTSSGSDIYNLTPTAISCNHVQLTWSDLPSESGYRVRRKLSGEATFTTIADLAANTTSYNDNSVIAGNIYLYMVRPLSGAMPSGISNITGATIPACTERNIEEIPEVIPNPFHENPEIKISEELLSQEAILHDPKGEEFKCFLNKISENTYTLTTEQLASGWYYLSVKVRNGTKTIKIFKE